MSGLLAVVTAMAVAASFALPHEGSTAHPQSPASGTENPSVDPKDNPTTTEPINNQDPGPAIKPSLTCGPPKNLTGPEKSRDAQFVRWYNVDHVIHLLGGLFEGSGTAYVGRGQPILLGFEWEGGLNQTPAYMDDTIIHNPNHNIRVVVDGNVTPGDWKSFYQPAFVAQTQCGPDWSWDHDGDGPGDGNGNGVGDFSGAVMFWRAPVEPLLTGTHTIGAEVTDDGGASWLTLPGGTVIVR